MMILIKTMVKMTMMIVATNNYDNDDDGSDIKEERGTQSTYINLVRHTKLSSLK